MKSALSTARSGSRSLWRRVVVRIQDEYDQKPNPLTPLDKPNVQMNPDHNSDFIADRLRPGKMPTGMGEFRLAGTGKP